MATPTTSASLSEVDAAEASKRYAQTASDRQRAQLEKLLKDPTKPAFVPAPPKEKALRAPREMMKNVQGSSAGAGSGEFHVYKASRRREYERIKMMEEESARETLEAEFERRKQERDSVADSKTAKNRAKRDKKKARRQAGDKPEVTSSTATTNSEAPLKKRRLVNGAELVFKRPGEESDEENEVQPGPLPVEELEDAPSREPARPLPIVDETARILIHED